MQAKSPTGSAAVLYHLLRPGDVAIQLRQLEVLNEMITKDQCPWIPTRLVKCMTADSTKQVWRCHRSSHKGVKEYKRPSKQEQHNWGSSKATTRN